MYMYTYIYIYIYVCVICICIFISISYTYNYIYADLQLVDDGARWRGSTLWRPQRILAKAVTFGRAMESHGKIREKMMDLILVVNSR